MRKALRSLGCLVSLLICMGTTAAQGRQVAITIDDLPRAFDGGPYDLAATRALTAKLLLPFREQKIPVIGFVNAARMEKDPKGLREILDLWLEAGADLGNHSYSHPDINSVALDVYTADIAKGEPVLRAALTARGRSLAFYRHPYLHTGSTAENKKGLQDFLDSHGYRVAPVTLDNSDYMYATAYQKAQFRERVRSEYLPYMESVVDFFERRSVELAGREFPQILLIHASQMNADLMPQLLEMFRRRGYTFITLAKALEDPVYQSAENYVGRGGFSWIHRWSQTKGMANKGEPDPPEWVLRVFAEAQ
jgi:peptidoglycan/xylan/chitin deacetylase (PgdA/CDA1 family)